MLRLPGLVVLFSVFICAVYAQDSLRQQIQRNFNQVKSIDPVDNDFTDLKSIGDAIGDARIVFLGEQDHGDAPTFLAKSRIIKYLHEQKGFDVLAFESDFWALNQAWELHRYDSLLPQQVRRNTFGIWSKCVQAQDVYDYVVQCAKTNYPLIMSGIDSQHELLNSKQSYVSAITTFTSTAEWFQRDTASLHTFLNMVGLFIENSYRYKPVKNERRFFLAYVDSAVPFIRDSFWRQEFRNLKADLLTAWELGFKASNDVRDTQMADNLLWLYHTKYPGKKIIIWAHSAHIAKNITWVPRRYNTNLGSETYKVLGDTAYMLGFTSLTGTFGRLSAYAFKPKVAKARKQSFESWVSEKSADFGFVNFRNISNKRRFYMKGVWHASDKADWTKMFDGVFYITQMYPCDRVVSDVSKK